MTGMWELLLTRAFAKPDCRLGRVEHKLIEEHEVGHLSVTPMWAKASSTNSRTLCVSPVAMTRSVGSFCCIIIHIACNAQYTRSLLVKPRVTSPRTHLHVVLGVAPVALGVDVAEFEAFLLVE